MKTRENFRLVDNKVIILVRDRVCETSDELLSSKLFFKIISSYVDELKRKDAPILKIFSKTSDQITKRDINKMIGVLSILTKFNIDAVPKLMEDGRHFIKDHSLISEFIEGLYNYWRQFERFIICDSTGDRLDKRPYRTFNSTIESLTHLIRQTYRDIEENITGRHPNIYRQTTAGAGMAVIALPKDMKLPAGSYRRLLSVPVIRQIFMYPPLLINPPMNKRTGKFERIDENPLNRITIDPKEWLCYPAKVGPLLVLVYIHEKFYELGLSLCNLFEIADDQFLEKPVDALYLFGVPEDVLETISSMPTVFFDDIRNGILTGFCPNKDQFGYFGYLKKMILTLHNIKVMKLGRMPFHGAMFRIITKNDHSMTILIFGDTGAGKSETIEALRNIGEDLIKDITIIADDMGSLEIDERGEIIGYGTEVGAFVRLDDLQPGYAFGQLDRAIIMNPSQINARIVLPVTTYENIIKGFPVDMILYANNYEEIDDEHPVIERLADHAAALTVFREGTAMSKGTTTSTGLVHTYFVNIFGAIQYKNMHEQIAKRFFKSFYEKGIFVGQLRTRLGISGWETKGPQEAALALLNIISEKGQIINRHTD